MKILFLGLTKAQYIYFKRLSSNLKCQSKVIFFPSLYISIDGFRLLKLINTEPILNLKFKEVDIKYKNSFYNKLYKLLLKFQIVWFILFIYRYLQRYNPEFLAIWNGKKFHQQLALEVIKILDIKPIFFENGVMPDTTTLDCKGVNASNSIPRDIEFFKNLKYRNIQLPKELVERKPKNIDIRLNQKIPKEYIFIPFQVAYDTQITQHSPWIENMFELFDIIKDISKEININFVIKEHPSDRISIYDKLYQKAGDKIIFSSQNTQTLIQNAKAVVTINSTVAIEAMLFYKRVVVLGEAFFAIDGLVKVAKDKKQLIEILKNIDKFNIDKELIDKFLSYLHNEYLIPDSWRNPTEKHFRTIERKIQC